MAETTYITKFMDALFPDGIIPTKLDIQTKIRTGTYTVRDSLILKLYKDGITFGAEDLAIDADSMKKLESTFKGTGKGTAKGLWKVVNRFKRTLDLPYFDVFKISPDETAMNIAKLEGKATAYTDVKAMHQNLDNITKLEYQAAGLEMPRGRVVVPQAVPVSRAEIGRYPKLAQAWETIVDGANSISGDINFGPKISTAFIFHNTNPMRIEDLLGFTVDPEVARRGTAGVARPYLNKLPTGEFELTLLSKNGRGKKHFNAFILDDVQVNMVQSYYDEAMAEYNQKKAYLAVEGNTLQSYNKEFGDKIKYKNGQIFGDISKVNYGKAITVHFKPLLEAYRSVITGVGGGEIVRKLQTTLLSDLFDEKTAKYFTSHSPVTGDVMKTYYKEQGIKRDITSKLHGPDDIVNVHTKKYVNTIGQALDVDDANKILVNAGTNVSDSTKKIPIDPQAEITGKSEPRNAAEQKIYDDESKIKSAARIAKSAQLAQESELATVVAGTAKSKLIQDYADENSLTFSQAKERLYPEKRGKPSLEASGKNQAVDSQLIDDLSKEHGIDKKRLIGKTWSQITEIVKKHGLNVAKGAGVLGGIYMADAVYKAGPLAMDIPEEEQTDISKIIRKGADVVGWDPNKAIWRARMAEELINPTPYTPFTMKGEESIPYQGAIAGSIEGKDLVTGTEQEGDPYADLLETSTIHEEMEDIGF